MNSIFRRVAYVDAERDSAKRDVLVKAGFVRAAAEEEDKLRVAVKIPGATSVHVYVK